MNALRPIEQTHQQVSPVRTLSDVVARIEADQRLSPVRRRDLISAVRRVARWLDRPVDQVPVDVRGLARELDALHPRTLGVSGKSFANVKSGLAAALNIARGGMPRRRRLSPEWRVLYHALPQTGGSRHQLSRFVGYCSEAAILPGAVDDNTIRGFRDHLDRCVGIADPANIARRAIVSWNKAGHAIAGWPVTQLTLPAHRKPRFRVRPEDLTVTLAADLDAYIAWKSGTDPLDDTAPTRPWKLGTQRRVRTDLEIMLACYRDRGHDLASLHGLADLIGPEVVKEVLRHRLDRNDGNPDSTVRHWMASLIAIARHWVRADDATLGELRRIQSRLGSQQPGLTAKNRRALGQFDDPANVQALLSLPESLMAEADRLLAQPGNLRRAALLAQKATAIAILLGTPMRISNLAVLTWHRDVIEPAGRTGPLLIDVPGETTKTGEPVCARLPDWIASLVRHYVRQHLPQLSGRKGARALFPGPDHAPKSANGLSGQLRALIGQRLGLDLTPHQFRHLAAKLMLTDDPGSYEAVRQLLGHRNMKTTTNAYAGLDMARAATFYDHVLRRSRGDANPASRDV